MTRMPLALVLNICSFQSHSLTGRTSYVHGPSMKRSMGCSRRARVSGCIWGMATGRLIRGMLFYPTRVLRGPLGGSRSTNPWRRSIVSTSPWQGCMFSEVTPGDGTQMHITLYRVPAVPSDLPSTRAESPPKMQSFIYPKKSNNGLTLFML